jgi:hypothetical protein
VDFRANRMRPVIQESPELADFLGTLMAVGALVGIVVLVAAAYLLAVRAIAAIAGDREGLRAAFLPSLVPIAFAYVVAHYFSLVILQGQFMAPLASDPFGFGWDLFGTADVRPDLGLLSPKTVWYAQVAALVVGHVAGLAIAHDRAVELYASPRKAALSQLAMLGLMVLYTLGGLWLLYNG